MLNIKEIKDKQGWNDFVRSQSRSQFLQSWEWGEMNEKENFKIFRVGIEDGVRLTAAATLIKKKIGVFSYWFCPRGPIIDSGSINFLFKEIEKMAKKENVIFLRFEPKLEIKNTNFRVVKSIDIEPSKTAIVNLQKTEEELLSAMHQKTRYNIRLAEKKGVIIKEGGNKDFDNFCKIMEETVDRDGFRLHDKDHYRQMLSLDNNFVRLFLAEYNGKTVAAVLASFFGDMITYVHGASSNEFRNVMAPYLLHWQIMKIGKDNGFKYYDLNGVDENKWPGVTRFKMGFGGAVISYSGTFDLVFNKKMYDIYRILRTVRRKF